MSKTFQGEQLLTELSAYVDVVWRLARDAEAVSSFVDQGILNKEAAAEECTILKQRLLHASEAMVHTIDQLLAEPSIHGTMFDIAKFLIDDSRTEIANFNMIIFEQFGIKSTKDETGPPK